jgi:hypothetical protein
MSRFTKISSAGDELPVEATEWDAVKDIGPAECPYLLPRYWARHLSPERMNFADAQKYPTTLSIAGFSDWRAPTVLEALLLADRTRHDPAIDPVFFPECQSTWIWTSEVDASSPSGYAWDVGFSGGSVYWDNQDYECFVRAVRVGQ